MKIVRVIACALLTLELFGTSAMAQANERGVAWIFGSGRTPFSKEERVTVIGQPRCAVSGFYLRASVTFTQPNGSLLPVVIESQNVRQRCGEGQTVAVRARVLQGLSNVIFQGDLRILNGQLSGELSDVGRSVGDRRRPLSLVVSGVPVLNQAAASFKDQASLYTSARRLIEADRIQVASNAYVNTDCSCSSGRVNVPFGGLKNYPVIGNSDPQNGGLTQCPAQRILMFAMERLGERFAGDIYYSPLTATFTGILTSGRNSRLVLHNVLIPPKDVACAPGCRNLCGNGRCEGEYTCAAENCPCAETPKTCPRDCSASMPGGSEPSKPLPGPQGAAPSTRTGDRSESNSRDEISVVIPPGDNSRGGAGSHAGNCATNNDCRKISSGMCCSQERFYKMGFESHWCMSTESMHRHESEAELTCMAPDGGIGGGNGGGPCANGECAP